MCVGAKAGTFAVGLFYLLFSLFLSPVSVLRDLSPCVCVVMVSSFPAIFRFIVKSVVACCGSGGDCLLNSTDICGSDRSNLDRLGWFE